MMMRVVVAPALAVLTIAAPAIAQRAKTAMGPSPIGGAASWITPDDYPADAIRSNRQGRVVAALGVDAAGRVIDCSIVESSGTESLDSKTCEIMLERGRFNPATDRRGRVTSSKYTIPVRWVMPGSDGMSVKDVASMPADEAVEYEVGIDPAGNIATCKIIERAASSRGDPCESVVIGQSWGARFVKDGAPVAVTLRRRDARSVRLTPAP